MSNFRTIIVPEAVKSIHAEDTTVLSMMDKLVQMATTKKLTLKQIINAIDAHLKDSTPPEVRDEECNDCSVFNWSLTIVNKILLTASVFLCPSHASASKSAHTLMKRWKIVNDPLAKYF